VAYFKVLSRRSPGETQKNLENLRTGNKGSNRRKIRDPDKGQE
jgi:hypothetical protein